MSCPVNHTAPDANDDGIVVPPEERLRDVEVPTAEQYKRLRNTMMIMVSFYTNGTKKKLAQYEDLKAQLFQLDFDKRMCEEQLKALEEFDTVKTPFIQQMTGEKRAPGEPLPQPEGTPAKCPVPHEELAGKTPEEIAAAAKAGGCPVDHTSNDKTNDPDHVVDGEEGYTAAGKKLTNLSEAMPTTITTRTHPKLTTYRHSLQQELQGLAELRKGLEEKMAEHLDLHKWSEMIVNAVNWISNNLDRYCRDELGLDIDTEIPDAKPLTEEQKAEYRLGLKEITYNLQESQDFFEASLDGRLHRYHEIEKNAIEKQLEVLAQYPEDNPRRQHIEQELKKDLSYCDENMQVNPQIEKKRLKMRRMHRDFFDVLAWNRTNLQELEN